MNFVDGDRLPANVSHFRQLKCRTASYQPGERRGLNMPTTFQLHPIALQKCPKIDSSQPVEFIVQLPVRLRHARLYHGPNGRFDAARGSLVGPRDERTYYKSV